MHAQRLQYSEGALMSQGKPKHLIMVHDDSPDSVLGKLINLIKNK